MRPQTHNMTGDEIIALSKKHTIFEWSAQGAVDPLPVARSKGVYFWTPDGKRFLDRVAAAYMGVPNRADGRTAGVFCTAGAVASYLRP